MEERIINLINDYSLQKIGREEFLKRFPKDILSDKTIATNTIEDGLLNENSATIDIGYRLMLVQHDILGVALNYNVLCKLLLSEGHFEHENIAFFLAKYNDTSIVDCLYAATQKKYDYLDYDDTYQFARKCIKALSAIGNDDAIAKLKLLSKNKNETIGKYSKKELMYLGVQL